MQCAIHERCMFRPMYSIITICGLCMYRYGNMLNPSRCVALRSFIADKADNADNTPDS